MVTVTETNLNTTDPNTWPMFLSVDQVCKILAVERHVVYQLISDRKLKAKKTGKQWRIKKTDLLNM